MIPVNNKKVIHKIARSQAKGNRNRNRLLLAAIILVTFLLTTVMSVGINYFKTTQERSASLGGGNVQGVMNGPSEKQLNTLRKEATIKTVGVSSMVGGIDQIGDDEVNVILLWGDNVYWNKQKKPATVEFKGHYPKAEDEILLSRKALKKMNITKPQLGMKLTVHGAFSYNGEFQQTFRLAGIYNDYTTSPMGFVSKKFWKVSGSKLDDVATTSANLNFSTPFFDQKDAKPLEKKLNFRERQYFSYDTRMANNLIKMIAALTTISLVIMICAYLVIYNILYISIHKEIHYYGLLKTIGTTQRQIWQIIFRQITSISVIGIPIGLLLGAGTSILTVSGIVGQLTYGEKMNHLSFHPLIFIGAALFSLITIYISVRKPTKIAAQISPIEAVNYLGNFSKRHSKESSNGGSVLMMAWRNIFRNKKQAAFVLTSLFLGITAFLVVNTIVVGNNGKRILEALDVDDMFLNNKTNMRDNQQQVFDQKLMKKLRQIKGVKDVHPLYAEKIDMKMANNPLLKKYMTINFKMGQAISYKEGIRLMKEKPQDFYGIINGIDEETFKETKQSLHLNISEKDFLAGEVCLLPEYSWMPNKPLKIMKGHEIHYGVKRRTHSVRVASVNDANQIPESQVYGDFPTVVMSEKFVHQLFGATPYIDHVVIDYKTSYDRRTDKQIKTLIKDYKIDDESKIDRLDNMHSSEQQLKVTGFVLAAILALLGLMNYFNTMVTSITSRLKEFALLESIGMTRKQQRKMLVLEGLSYGGISLGLTSSLGLGIAYLVFKATDEYGMSFLVPWEPVLLIYSLALLICIFIPLMIYRLVMKGSIIDQLRSE